jgi:hypothetical protein
MTTMEAFEQQRGAAGVALGTTGTGFSTALEILPTALGCVASLFGIALTIVLIINARKKSKILDRELNKGD